MRRKKKKESLDEPEHALAKIGREKEIKVRWNAGYAEYAVFTQDTHLTQPVPELHEPSQSTAKVPDERAH